MRIILHELRKIWRPGVLLLLAAFSVMFYYLFMSFNIDYFPNGHPATEIVNFSAEWTKKYGPTLELEEREKAEQQMDELYAEAMQWIYSDPTFAKVGIYSYSDAQEIMNKDEESEEEWSARSLLFSDKCGYIGFRIQALDNILEQYDKSQGTETETYFSEIFTPQEVERMLQIHADRLYQNIMPEEVIENLLQYIRQVLVLLILSMCILLAPLLVRDRITRVNELQVSSRVGRKIYWSQFGAVILSAFLLTTIELLIVGGIYTTTGTYIFRNNMLNSFLSVIFSWFDWNYGTYVLVMIGLAYLFALGTATFVFFMSRFSVNYITMILKLIPVFVVLSIISNRVTTYCFMFSNPIYNRTGIVGIEFIVCIALLVFGISTCIFTGILEKHKEFT